MRGYVIYKLPDGGYFVSRTGGAERLMYEAPLFASAKISECLEYVRENIEKPSVFSP